VLRPRQRGKLAWGTEDKEHAMSPLSSGIVTVGIDIGKNSFHVVGQDERGAFLHKGRSFECVKMDEIAPRPA
jgi:hypothetical protein